MSDPEVGPERCETPGCGKVAEPGRSLCYACDRGMLPEPTQPDPAAVVKLALETAAMLRRHAKHLPPAYRKHYLAEAQWFERRAAQITGAKEVA